MPYNSSSKKNQFPNAELFNDVQKNKISLQSWISTKMYERISKSQPLNTNIAKLLQWDTDWETVEYITQVGIVTQVWKGWNISIGRINQYWLNRFSIEILFRNGDKPFQVSDSTLFKKSVGWDIQDIEGNETSDMKDVTLRGYIHSQFINHPIFEVKLLVKYINNSIND